MGECKFTSAPPDYSVLALLESHIREIRWSPDGAGGEHECALFMRNRFRQSVRDAAADRDDLKLSDIKRIVPPANSTGG